MNICFISSSIPKPNAGGVDRVINNLAEGFIARGYGVSCCYLYRDSESGHIPYLECHRFPAKNCYLIDENIKFLVEFIKSNNISILMYEGIHSVLWDVCVQAKGLTGVKLVYQLHSNPMASVKTVNDRFQISRLTTKGCKKWVEILYNFAKLPYTYYVRYKYTRADSSKKYKDCDAFVSLSRYYTPILDRIIGGDRQNKLKAIINPILQVDTLSLNKKRQIVYVGRMEIDTKRADRALEIWQLLHKKHPDWSLKMVGEGTDRADLEQYAKDLGLKNVTFTGRTDSMPYFAESWVSLLTSSSEGFALVLLEAQQNGCIPLVYGSYKSVYDIINDGENGYVIPPFKRRKFADKISKLIEDVELRERMSANCRVSSEKFNLEKIVDQWESLFKGL